MKKQPKAPNKYIRFATAGFQMGLTIWLGNKLGKYLDLKFQSTTYESVVTLIAIFAAMYSIIKQVTRLSNDND